MGRIQSQFGLVTGTDIVGTVDQLIAISAQPRDRLVSRNEALVREQGAITELTASVIGVQLAGNRLADTSFFQRKSAESTNEDAVSVSAGSTAPSGSYDIRTLNKASTHRVETSLRFNSVDEALGLAGSIDLSPSGFLDQSGNLSGLNRGRGVESGSFRITDRSGESDVVDIGNARSIDDILTAINDANVDVEATTENGAIKLIDTSGSTDSNLVLEQLGNAETLADLGLYGIDEASDTAVGAALIEAFAATTPLSTLNDNRGVRFSDGTDLSVTLSDGSDLEIDFGDFSTEGPPATPAIGDPTFDDVISYLNTEYGTQISAAFNNGGLEITDLTGGSGDFTINNATAGSTASDLGLAQSTSGTTLTSNLPAPTLRGTSLDELGGGNGIGELTTLDVTTSDGVSASIDLSSATTTAEVVDAINASGLDVLARLNDSKTGLRLRDVSGGTGNFEISSADDTAANLGIAASTTDDIVTGTDLQKQTVNLGTPLSELNGGRGIDQGSFRITDSSGEVSALNLAVTPVSTVGDLVREINDLSIGVTASLSPNGDGIAITDTAGGSGTLTIEDTGSNTTAADLGLAGTASDVEIDGSTVSAIVGSDQTSIEIAAEDSLSSIVEKLNESGRYGTASIESLDDGSFRLVVSANQGGEQGKFALNTTGFDLGLRTASEGQDALIAYSIDGGSETFLTSSDGVFEISGSVGGEDSSVITENTKISALSSGAISGSFTIEDGDGNRSAINLAVDEIDTVGDLVDQINGLGLAVTASISNDGSQIAIVSDAAEGKVTITDVGNGNAASRLGIAGESDSITVNGVSVEGLAGGGDVEEDTSGGLSITVKELSEEPITITVESDDDGIIGAANTFADQYNRLADRIADLTTFDADSDSVGLLFGSSETLRISSAYENLLSGTIRGAGEIRSIGAVGFEFDDSGRLSVNDSQFREALEEDRDAVEAFFTTEENGLADQLDSLAERVAGIDGSLLVGRRETLQNQVDRNNDRVESLNARLDRERERLLLTFFRSEEAISRIQSNQSSLSAIEFIGPSSGS